ncbi:ATP-binding protein [Patescibacteria group bacterium]|nr:ATP-binding protein [Patescibacteria group bacterium]
MISDITYLGKIIRVDSSTVEVEVTDTIPSAAPIINGRLYKIGQIGTFVKIPVGNIGIYGIVSTVSNIPSTIKDENHAYDTGSRFLSVQLVGEKIGDEEFQKGVGTYPTINDEVHLVTERDLFDIYGRKDDGSIEIGKHSSSENLSVNADIHKLVLRHSAILGSTGSGKSNTTVSVLKAILNDYPGSRVILVDPHGEYASAFPKARVFKINDAARPLHIPFWLMTFDELAFFLVGAEPKDDQKPEYRKLRELVVEMKKVNAGALKSGGVDPNRVSADSPIPFNVRELWHNIYWWLNATFTEATAEKQANDNACVESNGDYSKLKPPCFKPYAVGSAAPFKSKIYQEFYAYEKKLISRLRDSGYDFLFHPGDYADATSPKDLHDLLNDWIGGEERLTILDLAGVPFNVLDITVGLITRFVFDSMFWGRHEPYTGRQRPLFIAFEEAHSYLNNSEGNNYAKNAVERVFKEGRKFVVGAMIISQRPSEISETILAQVGTFIALRLTNSRDQSIVKASAPDNLISLIDLLPSLRTGEALVIGEAVKIPSRVRIPLQTPQPTSEDPKLVECWQRAFAQGADDYNRVVTSQREQKLRK